MIEKYAGLRYNMDIAVLVVGGVVLFICLIVLLREMWKRK